MIRVKVGLNLLIEPFAFPNTNWPKTLQLEHVRLAVRYLWFLGSQTRGSSFAPMTIPQRRVLALMLPAIVTVAARARDLRHGRHGEKAIRSGANFHSVEMKTAEAAVPREVRRTSAITVNRSLPRCNARGKRGERDGHFCS